MVTMTVRPPKHLDYLEVKDFSHVLGTADGGLCHLNSYTALQCSWHMPGESQGRVGCRLWGRTELDTTEAT